MGSFYHSDFIVAHLHLHLDILASNFPDNSGASVSVMDNKEHVQKMSPSDGQLMAEVSRLLQLFLVIPWTNTISERSFNILRMVKNYLCSFMTQERLNQLLVLHAHKDLTDSMNLFKVANDFVAVSGTQTEPIWEMQWSWHFTHLILWQLQSIVEVHIMYVECVTLNLTAL